MQFCGILSMAFIVSMFECMYVLKSMCACACTELRQKQLCSAHEGFWQANCNVMCGWMLAFECIHVCVVLIVHAVAKATLWEHFCHENARSNSCMCHVERGKGRISIGCAEMCVLCRRVVSPRGVCHEYCNIARV